MADHLMNIHLKKKGLAHYDHSLPGVDCTDSADWGADDRLHIGIPVSTPEISDPPCFYIDSINSHVFYNGGLMMKLGLVPHRMLHNF